MNGKATDPAAMEFAFCVVGLGAAIGFALWVQQRLIEMENGQFPVPGEGMNKGRGR